MRKRPLPEGNNTGSAGRGGKRQIRPVYDEDEEKGRRGLVCWKKVELTSKWILQIRLCVHGGKEEAAAAAAAARNFNAKRYSLADHFPLAGGARNLRNE